MNYIRIIINGFLPYVLIVLVFMSCGKETQRGKRLELQKDVAKIIEKNAAVFLKDDRIHSVSIAVFNKKKTYSKHYGEVTIGENNPPTDSTLYELASVTKTFLGTLTARAVIEGRLSLNDTITNYLNGYYSNLSYKGQPILIKDILTHTGGFPNFPPTMENKGLFLEGLKQIEIGSEPGKEFHYSNTAPEIMAYILEQVYDLSYQNLVSKYILRPNGMINTKFELSNIDQNLLVQGYNGDRELQQHLHNNLWGGIAGIHSNTVDMLKYMEYHLDESDGVVLESHKSWFSTVHDFDIGYYWNTVQIDGSTCHRHHGGIWGMQNWIMIYPNDTIGIAVLSNTSFDGIDDKLEELSNNIFMAIK